MLTISYLCLQYSIINAYFYLLASSIGCQKKPLVRSRTKKIVLPQSDQSISSYFSSRYASLTNLVLIYLRSIISRGLLLRYIINASIAARQGSPSRMSSTTPSSYKGLMILSIALQSRYNKLYSQKLKLDILTPLQNKISILILLLKRPNRAK